MSKRWMSLVPETCMTAWCKGNRGNRNGLNDVAGFHAFAESSP